MAHSTGLIEWGTSAFRAFSMTPLVSKITDIVAIFAVIGWLNDTVYLWLEQFSEVAALLTPILGLVWLMIQMYIKITHYLHPVKRTEAEAEEDE